MHMIVGFVLASLLGKKKHRGITLPSINGKLEVVHALPGRLRLESPLLEVAAQQTRQRFKTEMTGIEGIRSADINPLSGSLLIQYDHTRINDIIVHGIVVKLLGLEQELEKAPVSRLTRESALIGRALDQQIYQATRGIMDLRSSLMVSLLMLALYRLLLQGDRTLPGGMNLLWWAYVVARQD